MATASSVLISGEQLLGYTGAQFWPLYNAHFGTHIASYTDWCQAYIRYIGDINGIDLVLGAPLPIYVPSVRDRYLDAGRYYIDNPLIGDLIFFSNSRPGKTTARDLGSHVGIIKSVSGNDIGYLNGNAGDTCLLSHCNWTASNVIGVGRPAYSGVVPSGWIVTRRPLTQTQMQHNARLFADYFRLRGWSLAAICGVLGNIQIESTINPGAIQGWRDNPPSDWSGLGYGLVQWTPGSHIWVDDPTAVDSGPEQCRRIYQEINLGQWGQYLPTRLYPQTRADYMLLSSPELAASVWLHNYERPYSYASEDKRRANARTWYTYLGGIPPAPERSRRKMPLWMYLDTGGKKQW